MDISTQTQSRSANGKEGLLGKELCHWTTGISWEQEEFSETGGGRESTLEETRCVWDKCFCLTLCGPEWNDGVWGGRLSTVWMKVCLAPKVVYLDCGMCAVLCVWFSSIQLEVFPRPRCWIPSAQKYSLTHFSVAIMQTHSGYFKFTLIIEKRKICRVFAVLIKWFCLHIKV